MQAKRVPQFALSLLGCAVALTGCFGVEKTNEHLASMDTSTKQMTTSTTAMSESTAQLSKNFAADQEYIKAMVEQMAQMNKHMLVMEQELTADREYIKSVTQSLKEMSESIEALRKMGDTALAPFTSLIKNPQVPAVLPTIEDLVKGAGSLIPNLPGDSK